MALNILKKFICILLLLKLAWTKEKPVDSVASIDKSLEDLKEFCTNKNSVNFCSPGNMGMAMGFLQRQRDTITKNIEKTEREERKSQRTRLRNRIKGDKMIWALRERFLDRHF
jgi:hypothetical protein